jgi:hypothetical protein
LNFIFGIVCLFVCVCAFSLRRESPDMILGDKPLIFEVVLSHLEGARGTQVNFLFSLTNLDWMQDIPADHGHHLPQ